MAPGRAIAFLTDFGGNEFYASIMRAVVASASPSSHLIDLTHAIPPHDIAKASFVLWLSIRYVPPDAVVVVVVDPGVGGARRGIVIETAGRVLVGPDNGFASDLLAGGAEVSVTTIDEERAGRLAGIRARGATFHGRDVFGPVAAAIARGAAPRDFGDDAGGIRMLREVPSVSIDGGGVRGTGRYVDNFGNVLSDIPLGLLESVFGATLARVRVSIDGRNVGTLRRAYVEGAPGELFALVNSWDCVEAALNGGSAGDSLGGREPEQVRFELRSA